MTGAATEREELFMKNYGYYLRYDEEGHKEFVKDLPTGAQNIIRTRFNVQTKEEVDRIVHNISVMAGRAARREA